MPIGYDPFTGQPYFQAAEGGQGVSGYGYSIQWVGGSTGGSYRFVPVVGPAQAQPPAPKVENFTPAVEDEDMAKLANKFEIGCDPEFVVVGAKGELVNVAVLGDHAAGPVAADHGGLCAEVRPDKARGAWTLIKRIQQILKEHPKLEAFRNSRWRGGALFQEAIGAKKVSLGGHIHFNIGGSEWCIEQTNALDRVTKYLEGLDILPTVECQARRKYSHHGIIYGHFSDVRYGNADNHVEYRTMASWLHDPWIAFLALTLAKLAVTAPEAAAEKFSGGADIKKLRGFLENFRGKDINADRLLEKFAVSSKWLAAKPDADIKQAWSAL